MTPMRCKKDPGKNILGKTRFSLPANVLLYAAFNCFQMHYITDYYLTKTYLEVIYIRHIKIRNYDADNSHINLTIDLQCCPSFGG